MLLYIDSDIVQIYIPERIHMHCNEYGYRCGKMLNRLILHYLFSLKDHCIIRLHDLI